MNPKKRLAAALLCTCLGIGANASAETISYYLDQSNELADGINYLQVTIADGAGGDINVEVTILQPLLDIADPESFGLASFGFNATSAATASNIVGLPDGWDVDSTRNQDGFGSFELVANESGANDRITPTLAFSIVGIAGDSVYDYVALSSGGNSQYFAAHVAGFDDPDTGKTSAYFAGMTPVPVPAAIWLLGSALLCFGAIGKRHQRPLAAHI